MRHLRVSALATSSVLALVVPSVAQVQVVADGFESGAFDARWGATNGSSTRVVFGVGAGAGGSNRYARVQGVSNGQGGLAAGLAGLSVGSAAVTDFTLSLALRVDAVPAGTRQFSVIVSASSSNPNTSSSHVNLRYQDGRWQAFGTNWVTLVGVGSIVPGTWNQVVITGTQWGSGIAGRASYGVQVTDHNGVTTSSSGIKVWQTSVTAADQNGAMAIKIQDIWGSNPGFDVDDVVLTAHPLSAPPTTATLTPIAPVAFSGVYPHAAASNGSSECGIGALIHRDGKLWYVTYPPHSTTGTTTDHLYSLDTSSLALTTWFEYPGGTHANRYRDSARGLDVIGAAYIDAANNVRFLPVNGAGDLRGRITGCAPDPQNPGQLLYATMEEGLYRVDLTTPASPRIVNLRGDGNHGGPNDLPGRHGKGLYAGQGLVYYTNNGAGNGRAGTLAAWNGIANPSRASGWTVVDGDRQFTEVSGPRGPVDVDPNGTDPIWALGWDRRSALMSVRELGTGAWTRYRLPMASYTHGHPNGWYTEWPRIRDVGIDGGHLMNHHGTFFTMPSTFAPGAAGGVRPVSTFLKMVVDYVELGEQIVFAANDASKFSNPLVRRSNSNLLFVPKAELLDYGGRPQGAGGVWVDDAVVAGVASDAIACAGYVHRVLHLANGDPAALDVAVEVDPDGSGSWVTHRTITVPAGGYAHVELSPGLDAEWLRCRASRSVASATAYLLFGSPPTTADPTRFHSVVEVGAATSRTQGVLRTMSAGDHPLEFAADELDASGAITGTGYYRAQLNPTTARLEIVAVADPVAESALRTEAATSLDYGVDAASAWISDGGTRFRLPKGDAAYDTASASGWRRGKREIVTERSLWNVHGTIYEVPRSFSGGGVRRLRPVTTHGRDIYDYASWRGMLVLAGNVASASPDEHFVRSDDGRVGLWFGNVDDLWKLGAPRGEGGPWANTSIGANVPSDPYLMYGYANKRLELSHSSGSDVTFTVEVDFLGDGTWHEYGAFTVAAGTTWAHRFPTGFAAHWVRVAADSATTATAHFAYTNSPSYDPRFGAGCARTLGVSSLTPVAGSLPWVGSTFQVEVDELPASISAAVGLIGFGTTQWAGLPLPLTFYGDCRFYHDVIVSIPLPLAAPITTWSLSIPTSSQLMDLVFYQQVLVPDLQAPFGVVLSDAARAVIGVR